MAALKTIPATSTIDEIASWCDRDGAVIVTDLVGPELLDRINRELDPILDARVPGYGYLDNPVALEQQGRNTRRLMGLAAKSDAGVECMTHPLILGYADHELGTPHGGYQLNMAQVIEIGPGEPEQVLHVDEIIWPRYVRPVDGPPLMFSCMVALTEFTEENGATRVAMGSHVLDVDWEAAPRPETVPAEMAPGSGLFFKGRVAHGGGANRTSQWRRGMTLTYCANWLRTEEATPLSVSLERARQLPRTMQELLGFKSVYGSYLVDTPQIMLWAHDMGDVATLLEVDGESRS
ncbi:phytanoyl-CoA dioxygenase family protein [Streptomyces sp. NPDC059755]|uniref:phytanoyl-CoA dioxygenase family protein n=1 Tax=Streptomyces sp. NPDC059755 TaxID=3346934 RepID=UPI00365C5632